jgi:hypothetical protein
LALQTRVEIIDVRDKRRQRRQIIFSDSDSINDKNIYKVFENTPCHLNIKLNENDRLYIDGLNSIDYYHYQDFTKVDDDNQLYIRDDASIPIYKNLDESVSYLPGYYTMDLVHANHHCYAILHVKSKLVKDDEYRKMIVDIEKIAEGLSQDTSRYVHGITSIKRNRNMNSQVDILIKNFNNFQNTLFQLRQKPRNEISSIYKWSNNIISSLDYKSTIKMSQHPHKNEYYSKHNILNYNTSDNINLKNNLTKLSSLTNHLYEIFKKPILKEYSILIEHFLLTSWIKNVSQDNIYNKLGSSLMNYNYSYIQDLINELESAQLLKNGLNRNFAYAQKSSSKLYEIWGFFRVINAMKKIGFTTTKENIFDNDIFFNIKKGLKDNASLTLEKHIDMDLENGLFIHDFKLKADVIYNSIIPKNSNSQHMFTTNDHDKPDIRIDFYDKKNTFVGSLIVDTKYRKKCYIYMSSNNNGSYNQLNAYLSNIHHNAIFDSDDYQQDSVELFKEDNTSVVRSVGAMYPGDNREHINSVTQNERNKNIISIIDYPGNSYDNLTSFLNDGIKLILKNVNHYLIDELKYK